MSRNRNSSLRSERRSLRQVKQHASTMSNLSDDELASLTSQFKDRFAKGESLDSLLPEAFAAICEADKRVLGLDPYDVQILGGIALHKGFLTEMNTGEGKTLVATLPLYLNALSGESCFLLTSNDYLALRDMDEMGPVYRFMGLTVDTSVSRDSHVQLSNAEKKQIYAADIVYTTHSILGFDYLINNLVTDASERFLREFNYVIIDEADAVLLDAAQTPLVISGSPRRQSNLADAANFFVQTLEEGEDYEIENDKVWLSDEGVEYAESYFQLDNIFNRENFEINRNVSIALRSHYVLNNGEDYLVMDGQQGKEIVLLNKDTGRPMHGMKLRGGMHQALENKENIAITPETRSVAAITYQSFFRLFSKMAGMSGTISESSRELRRVYGVKARVIPPNRPVQRVDYPDSSFATSSDQIAAAIAEIEGAHATGRPVLVIVPGIYESELISRILTSRKIPHNVLNAHNEAWEAQIIKDAGQIDAVTVATSMAGRGTDIRLGNGACELGGLAVVGVGRMSDQRLERQARGRAGRQGDPGSSKFFVSLEDEVVVHYGPESLGEYAEGKRHASERKLRRSIDRSQNLSTEYAELSRKRSFENDKAMRRQRELVYQMRNRLLDGGTLDKGSFLDVAKSNIDRYLCEPDCLDEGRLKRFVFGNISYQYPGEVFNECGRSKRKAGKALFDLAEQSFDKRKESLGAKAFDRYVRMTVLQAIDAAWIDQVDYLQQLTVTVSTRSFAQRNVEYEYKSEARKSYTDMVESLYADIMKQVLLGSTEVLTDGLKTVLE